MLSNMEEKEYIVDRIEGDSIVLEEDNGDIIVIDIDLFEARPKEGDVIVMCGNSFSIDHKATVARKERINALMKGMWK